MPRLDAAYRDSLRALPWREVLPRLGLTPPRSEGAFLMRCRFRDAPSARSRGEKSASLRFTPDGRFRCFSCGTAGDVFDFVRCQRATGSHHPRHGPGDPPPAARPGAYRSAFRFFRSEFGIG